MLFYASQRVGVGHQEVHEYAAQVGLKILQSEEVLAGAHVDVQRLVRALGVNVPGVHRIARRAYQIRVEPQLVL